MGEIMIDPRHHINNTNQYTKKQISTETLIHSLSQETEKPILRLNLKHFLFKNLVFFLGFALILQSILGYRFDLAEKLHQINFTLEILFLLGLMLSSMIAAGFYMYPDVYQQYYIKYLPHFFWVALLALIAINFFTQDQKNLMMDAHLHMNQLTGTENFSIFAANAPENSHGIECLICIVLSAFLPFLVFAKELKKGATVHARQTSLMLALTAFSVSCLTLRLAEVTDDSMHLVMWHYLPSLFFCLISALFGRSLFKWH
jgi:hypothetical protein